MRRPYTALVTLSLATLALAAVAMTATPASAQSIRGTVVEHATDRPLAGVHVLLLDSLGVTRAEAFSGEEGGFVLEAEEPGTFLVTAEMIGFAAIRSDTLRLEPREELVVEIRLDIEAVLLEPVVVRSRSRMGQPLSEFYDRMERGRKTGFGYFVSREDVDRRSPLHSTDLLRMAPGVRVVSGRAGRGAMIRMTGGCVPAIYVDGMRVNRPPLTAVSLDDYVPAVSLEGIEVYRGASAQQGAYYDPSGCGLILVWTRRGSDSGHPWSWRRFLAGSALVGALFLLFN